MLPVTVSFQSIEVLVVCDFEALFADIVWNRLAMYYFLLTRLDSERFQLLSRNVSACLRLKRIFTRQETLLLADPRCLCHQRLGS